jgi:hypothetical protein
MLWRMRKPADFHAEIRAHVDLETDRLARSVPRRSGWLPARRAKRIDPTALRYE